MNKIKYPTLDLFIYNLTEVSPTDTYDKYWFNLPTRQVDEKSAIITEKNPKSLRFEVPSRKIDGSYSRIDIDDTFCLNYSCSCDDEVELSRLSALLTELKNFAVLPQVGNLPVGNLSENGYQGETWMISGWTIPSSGQVFEQEAIELYKSIIPAGHQYLITGTFLNATVYEMWRGKSQWEGIEKNSHIIIVFYPDEQTFINVSQNYYLHWQALFAWRHKIIWAYQQGRELKSKLARQIQSNQDITALSRDLATRGLGQLKTELNENNQKSSLYIQNINWLQIQKHTVQINLNNYQIQCKKYFNSASWLLEFSNIVEKKYQIQLEQDYLSLNAGLALLENVTNMIRGVVEIEQAQRDRRLEQTIAVAGFGLATSQIASSIILVQKTPKEGDPFYRTEVFWHSIGAGLLASLILLALLNIPRFWRFFRNK